MLLLNNLNVWYVESILMVQPSVLDVKLHHIIVPLILLFNLKTF